MEGASRPLNPPSLPTHHACSDLSVNRLTGSLPSLLFQAHPLLEDVVVSAHGLLMAPAILGWLPGSGAAAEGLAGAFEGAPEPHLYTVLAYSLSVAGLFTPSCPAPHPARSYQRTASRESSRPSGAQQEGCVGESA